MKRSDIDARGHTSGQFKTYCPLCRDSRSNKNDPSLSVNLDDNVYDCHHCGEVGKFEDAPYSPKHFAAKEKKYIKPDPVALAEKTEVLDDATKLYFQNRGISPTTLLEWGINVGPSFAKYDDNGYVVKRDGVTVYEKGIRFPYYENGELVWMKHLRPREWTGGDRMLKSFKDGKPVPFGLDRAGKVIYIVEGEIDALSFYEAGYNSVWSVPNGAKSFGFLEFESVVSKLMEANLIVLAGDNDADGIAMRTELIRRLGQLGRPANSAPDNSKIALLLWPEGIKDANQFLTTHSVKELSDYISREVAGLPIDGISEADEFAEEFFRFYKEGLPKGVSTGIEALDPIYRVMPGMFTIVTGVTNYGKSEIVDEIVRNMILKENWKFAFYSPENTPMSLHMIKLAEKFIGKPYDRTKPGHMSEQEAHQAFTWIHDNIFYINPRGTTFSIDEILERARVLIYRKGIQGLIIDPWNYVRKDFNGLREDQYINQEMQKIGVFNKATGIHTWLTVHPRTLKRDKNEKIQVPTVMELSGGSKFGDNADFIFAVHRDPQLAHETGIHEVVFHEQKSRYKYAAKQGNVKLLWNPFNGRFNDPDMELPKTYVPTPVTAEPDEEYVFDDDNF